MSSYSTEATTRFLARYRELENEDSRRLEQMRKLYREDMDMYRAIRNCLTHEEMDGSYPFAVSEDVVASLEEKLRIMQLTAMDVRMPRERLVCAEPEEKLIDAIKVMGKRNFSYLPMLDENDVLHHVCSEKGIVDILAANRYSKNLEIASFEKYFEIDNQNEMFYFIAADAMAVQAKNLFEAKVGIKRCNIVFVTETGERDSRVLGIITPHDVINI